MATPLIMYVGVAAQAMPVVTSMLVWGRNPPAPVRQLCVLCIFFIQSDVALAVARLWGPNRWVTWITHPVEVALTLWMLREMLAARSSRRWYTLAMPLVLLASLVSTLLVSDPVTGFDGLIGPFLSLVALIATLHTALGRTLQERNVLPAQDWFWLCAGLALFWLQYVAIDAFTIAVLDQHRDWAIIAYQARAAILPIAFGLLSWGVWLSRDAGVLRAHRK